MKVFSRSGFSDLCRNLCKKTIKNGFYLIKNGKIMRNGKKCQFFVCNHNFTNISFGEIKDKSHFRVNTFHNNRKNSRGKDGKKLCRRRISKRSSCCENRCCYSMFITFDDIGFYDLSHVGC